MDPRRGRQDHLIIFIGTGKALDRTEYVFILAVLQKKKKCKRKQLELDKGHL